jgi:hypothetical protein
VLSSFGVANIDEAKRETKTADIATRKEDMMSEGYNGWTNRATWVINVHDFFNYEQIEEVLKEQIIPEKIINNHDAFPTMQSIGVHKLAELLLADWMQEYFNEVIEEYLVSNMAPFIRDLIDSNNIDWKQLASHYEELIGECIKEIVNSKIAK